MVASKTEYTMKAFGYLGAIGPIPSGMDNRQCMQLFTMIYFLEFKLNVVVCFFFYTVEVLLLFVKRAEKQYIRYLPINQSEMKNGNVRDVKI